MLLALNIKGKLVNAEEEGVRFYCPKCGARVTKVTGRVNIHHFRHSANCRCTLGDGLNDDYNWKQYWQMNFDKSNRDVRIWNEHVSTKADILINNTVIYLYEGDKSFGDFENRIRKYQELNQHVVVIINGLDKGIHQMISSNGTLYYKWDKGYKICKYLFRDVDLYVDTSFGLIKVGIIYNPDNLKAFTGKVILQKDFIKDLYESSWHRIKKDFPEVLKTESFKVLDNNLHVEDHFVRDSLAGRVARNKWFKSTGKRG